MDIPILQKYASFLLDNHLDELVSINIQKAQETNIPLLKFFKDFTAEQLLEYLKQDLEKFLSGIIEGSAEDNILQNASMWKENNISRIERNEINPKDIVLTPYIRKNALLTLLEKYTKDVSVFSEVVKDIEKYFLYEQEQTLTIFSQIQQEIFRNEKEFSRLVIETTNDGITAFDKDEKVTVWNKSVERTTGVSKDLILGKKLFSYFPDYEHNENGKAVKEVLKGKHQKLSDQPYQHKEGYYEIELVPIFNDAGGVVGGLTISRETTQRKNAQEEIRNKNHDLQQINQQLTQEIDERKRTEKKLIRERGFSKTLMESPVNGIVALDTNLRYTEWNSFMEKLLGTRADEVIGKHILEVFPDSSDSQSYIAFNKALKGETTVILDQKYTSISSGAYNAYVMPVYDELENIHGVLSLIIDISEKKRTEEDLVKSRHFLKKVMDIVPGIITVFDLDSGKYLFMNEGIENILGYSSKVAFEHGINYIYQLIHPDDLPVIIKKNSAAIEAINSGHLDGDEAVRYVYRIKHKNGSWRWLKTIGAVFEKNDRNKVQNVLHISIDITERIEAETKLKEIQHFVEKIADIAPYPIAVVDLSKGKPIYVNRESLRTLGYSDEQIKQKQAEELINAAVHPDDIHIVVDREQKIRFMSDDDELESEYRVRNIRGEWIWLLSKIKVFKRNDAGQVEQYISISANITEKKLHELEINEKNQELSTALEELKSADENLIELNHNLERKVIERTEELARSEEELRQTLEKTVELNEALAASEKQIRLITDSLPVLISYVNQDEKYSFVNRAYEDWFRISREEIIGKHLGEVLGEPAYQNMATFVQTALRGERQEFENKIEVPGYGLRFVQGNLIPDDLNGNVKGIYALITNVTQRKQDEIHLQHALAESEKLNAELKNINGILDNFIHMAAHDLRAPVANLRSLMYLIGKTADQAKKNEFLKAVSTSIERLDNTINGLVEVVEVQSKSPNLVKELTFEKVFTSVFEEVKSKLEVAGGEIQTHFEAPSITYIEPYLECVMRNLITNSIKYHSEERPLHIQIKTLKADGYILMEIEDTGTGMDLQRYGRNLFRPFTRFSKKTEGKGIGLHLVKSIVEKNGGRVEVRSSLEKGTTFQIYLKDYEN